MGSEWKSALICTESNGVFSPHCSSIVFFFLFFLTKSGNQTFTGCDKTLTIALQRRKQENLLENNNLKVTLPSL